MWRESVFPFIYHQVQQSNSLVSVFWTVSSSCRCYASSSGGDSVGSTSATMGQWSEVLERWS